MSSIYQHLYKSPDFEKIDLHSYFEELTETLFNLYNVGNTEIKLETNFIPLSIDSKKAEALALILNELVSNALKYAFKNEPGGMLQIGLTLNNKEVTLTVQDNGPGLPEKFDFQTNDSLGLKLVNLLTKQINGKLNIESQNGLKVQVSFQV
jgi:two-component system, sensor histidine kinase PdtaS